MADMAIADARIPRWDVKATIGQTVELSQRWFDRDADAAVDLSEHTVRIWLGGSIDEDVDDLTGATEVVPTVEGEFAYFTWGAGSEDRVLRTTYDGSVVTLGYERVYSSARNANSGDAAVFVNNGFVSCYVSVHIGAAGAGGEGGQVNSVVAGTGVSVNSTNPAAPIVSLSAGSQTNLGLAATALQPDDVGTAAAEDVGAFDAAGTAAAAVSAHEAAANPHPVYLTQLEGDARYGDIAAEVPTGGTTGQVLKKDSNTDYDFSWQDDSGVGGTGVDSVNGETGVVTLDLEDVSGLDPVGNDGMVIGVDSDAFTLIALPATPPSTIPFVYSDISDARPSAHYVFWIPDDPELGDPTNAAVDDVVLRSQIIEPLMFALSDETTALTTGNGKLTYRAPYAFTIVDVRASLTTASSSGAVTVDINEAGATLFTTPLTIDQGETTSVTAATPHAFTDTAVADDAQLRFDIDGAGTGAAGLKVTLYVVRA